MRVNAVYDQFAAAYARHSERSPVNAYYDRPAILALAGDVSGSRVLELGCAAGVLSTELVDRGACLLAVDREPRMVDFARRRLGTRARVEVADVSEPLDVVGTDSVDVVVASLLLHYLEDWSGLLAELHRCLIPGGALVFSMHHPAADWQWGETSDYLDAGVVREMWDVAGHEVPVEFYRRPLSAVFGQLRQAGFAVDVVDEPRPLPELAHIAPDVYREINSHPVFLFIRAHTARSGE